jgi:hypothetical protein
MVDRLPLEANERVVGVIHSDVQYPASALRIKVVTDRGRIFYLWPGKAGAGGYNYEFKVLELTGV